MSTTQVRHLIEEINYLLSRPIGSVSRASSPETLQQRERLKHLRSQLEGATADKDLSDLAQECNLLISQMKGEVQPLQIQPPQIKQVQPLQIDALRQNKLDKLDIRQKFSERSPLLHISQPSFLSNNSDLIKEGSIMADTPESNLPSMNEQIVAIVQHTIHQTIQNAVAQSVQASIEQNLKQALITERSAIVSEISANLKSFVDLQVDAQIDNQQRSQVSQELELLEQQKQVLRQEIVKLEADRQTWMAQFDQVARSQQEAFAQTLQQTLQKTLHEAVTQTVNRPVSQSLTPLLNTQEQGIDEAARSEESNHETRSPEFVQHVQQQTDHFLLNLDAMFNATFRSLEQNIHSYKTTMTEQLDQMQSLEQKGKSLIDALVEQVSIVTQNAVTQNAVTQNAGNPTLANQSVVATPSSVAPEAGTLAIDLPADIDPRYFDTTPEHIDEVLVSTLLAGGDATHLYPDVIHDADVLDQSDRALNRDEASDRLVPEVVSQSADLDADLALNPDLDTTAVTETFELIAIPDLPKSISTPTSTSPSPLTASLEKSKEKSLEISKLSKQSESKSNLAHKTSDRPTVPAEEDLSNEDPALLAWLERQAQLPKHEAEDDVTDLTSWLNHKSIAFSQSTRADDIKGLNRPSDTDNAENSDESLILLPDVPDRAPDPSKWIDELTIQDLNADLENLEIDREASAAIASSLNQVIRDTPFSGVPAEMASVPRQPAIQLSQSASSRVIPSKLSASIAEVASGSNSGINLDLTLDRDLELLGIPQIIENPDDLFVEPSDIDDCVIQEIQEPDEQAPSFAIDPEIHAELNIETEASNPFVPLTIDSADIDAVDSEILPFDASSLPAIELSSLESTAPVIPNAIDQEPETPFDEFEPTDAASPFAIGDRDDTAALFVEEIPTSAPSPANAIAIPIAIEICIAEDEPEAVAAEIFPKELAVEASPPDDAEAIFAEVLANQAKGKSSVVTASTETEDEIDALFLGLNVNPTLEPVSPYNSSTKFTPIINPDVNKPPQFAQPPKKSLAFTPATPKQISNINSETPSNPNSAITREFEKVMNDLEHDIDQDLETLIFAIDPNPNIVPSQKAPAEIKQESIQAPPLPDSDFGDEFDELDRLLQAHPEEIETQISNSNLEVEPVDDIMSLSEQFETVLHELAFAAPTTQDLSDETVTPHPAILAKTHNAADSDADDFSQVLDDLEASLPNPSPIHSIKSPNLNPSLAEIEEELSAEDFFASLGGDQDGGDQDNDMNDNLDRALNEFADRADRDISDDDFLKTLEDELLSSDRDLQLSNFADSGELDRVDSSSWEQFVEKATTFSGLAVSDSSSDSMKELESVLFGLEAIDFDFESKSNQFEKLDLSTEEHTLDVESQVIASERVTPIPPEPPEPPYSIDDTWFLGIDFGSTYMRSSLVNAQTGRVYPLTMHSSGELSEQVVFNSNFTSGDRASDRSIDGAIQHVSTQASAADTAVSHFKSFLKLGLPYRGLSAWQPMLQWSHSQQITLKSLVTALQDLLVKLQSEVSHDKLPDLHEILQNLSGVILGHPPEWSDTYVHNLREAVLNAGVVTQAEQVMVTDQAIAPVLWFLHQNKSIQQITLTIDAGAATTSLCLIKALGDPIDRSHIYSHSIDYAGLGIDQDIVTQLLYPHWQIVTNPARESCHLDPAILPEPSDPAPMQRALLQQTLLSSAIGKKLLEFANQIKLELFSHPDRVQWSQELEGQPLTVQRREVEGQILQPYIQRLNRELNLLLSIAGMTGEDVAEVWQLGGTMAFPSLSRWLVQKLPFANMNTMPMSTVANGLAVAPLFPQLLDISRQQYSDYFLLQEICRLNLRDALTPKSLLQQLQNRGINIKVCRDRILTFLQGDIPSGLFPWLEPQKNIVLSDPSLPPELFTGRLFELETDGSYKPNVLKFQQLSNYLQSILATMRQTLNEPLVFPEFKIAVKV